jgi:hypothetical protein
MTVIRTFRPPVVDGAGVAEFRRSFNTACFEFGHQLGEHPLFSIGQLMELAERMIASGGAHQVVGFSATRGGPERKFDQLARRDGARDALADIEAGSSWLRMSFVQAADPRYREIHDQILEEAEFYSGSPVLRNLSWSSMTVMVSSPTVVTPYHIDHESNLLFQIAGEKDIWLFDANDSRVLADEEIETFYIGNIHAASFRPDAEGLGRRFHLSPGRGVYNPPLGPHWVKNGGAVSVSVSLNFSLRPSERQARVYQMNYYLRRMGRHPRRPKKAGIVDWTKGAAMRIGAVGRPRNLDDLLQPGPRRLWKRLRRFHKSSGTKLPSPERSGQTSSS